MKITKIREVKTPTRGTECSAGLYFYVPKGFTARLTSGTDILVPSGIRAQLPHFASKLILVKALTRCLKKTEAVRGMRERWLNNKR